MSTRPSRPSRPPRPVRGERYDWSDYVCRNQSEVYAVGWGNEEEVVEEERNNARIGMVLGGVGIFLSSFVIALSVRYGYNAYITTSHAPPSSGSTRNPHFGAGGANSQNNGPSSWSELRGHDITEKLKALSGPLVSKTGTYQNMAASWIIEEDNFSLSPESPYLNQRYIMALIYFSMGGEKWHLNPWLDGKTGECNWKKVSCNDDAEIISLDLDSVNIRGKLPPEISALSSLQKLDLHKNHITGFIPRSWGGMKSLEYLYLEENDLTGSVPESMCNLRQKSLHFLTVDCNTNPPQLACTCCTNCHELESNNDSSSGTPSQPAAAGGNDAKRKSDLTKAIGKISDPSRLTQPNTPQARAMNWIVESDAARLDADSPILQQRYILTLLYYALGGEKWPYKNWLAGEKSGCTFPGISCKGGQVTTISLVSRSMTGRIPSELSRLTSLEFIDFSDNHISGTIPDDLEKLTKLEKIYLQQNDLVGNVPGGICKLQSESLEDMKVDCTEVSCACCSNCNVNSLDKNKASQKMKIAPPISMEEEQADDTPTTENKPVDSPAPPAKNKPADSPAPPGKKPDTQTAATEQSHAPPSSETDADSDAEETDSSKSREDAIREVLKGHIYDEKRSKFREDAFSWIVADDIRPKDPKLAQRYVLAVLYFALGGENWKNGNWLMKGQDECTWFGITCDGHKRVSKIDLSSNNLSGAIPDEISFLEYMTDIDMSKNSIKGEIPEGIANLFFLEKLHLYANELFGKEPSDLCYLTYGKLGDLRLDCNVQCACCVDCGPPDRS